MAINYVILNVDTEIATAVFVKNLMDSAPTELLPVTTTSITATATTPEFLYLAWQLLNPSPSATQQFTYDNSRLSVIIEGLTANTGSNNKSEKISVQVGSSYVLNEDGTISQSPQTGNPYVEIAIPQLSESTVNIEWYLSGTDISQGRGVGITNNISAGMCARYQPGNDALLFYPISGYLPSNDKGYTQAVVSQATYFQPSLSVTSVDVTVAAKTPATPAVTYTFNTHN